MAKVHGYTVSELMKLTKKKENAIRQAIHVYEIKPLLAEYVYPLETLDIILNAPPRGRPKKKPS